MGRVGVAVVVSLWVIPISLLVNRVVPQPYMDEIFHVPQAQRYCAGHFRTWDPMITTPPGLYYLSLAHVASLFPGMFYTKAASTFFEACSTTILRSTNGVLAVLCSIIMHEIITHLKPGLDDRKATLYSIILSMFPLHWFFTFLYYTDIASVTVVLAMYLSCLKKSYWFSGLLGALAVAIRQTNVIWMLFVVSSEVMNIALGDRRDKAVSGFSGTSVTKKGQVASENSVVLGSNLRKRKTGGRVVNRASPTLSANAGLENSMPGLIDEISSIFGTVLCKKTELLVSFLPFILVLAAFVAFVRWNGSIVLGAKEAHAVSPHFAQIMYFGLFSALLMAPLYFSYGQAVICFRLLRKFSPRIFLQAALTILAGFISVHYFSIAHPYLLADNRHYPFYLWRKTIGAHWSIKYLLVPLYLYSWLSILSRLGKAARKKIWVLGYFVATALVLVPAPLIEFRYYTIPFFFLVLHAHDDDLASWVLMGFLYFAINVFTMIMFLYRPFQWEHEPGMIQRFMW